MRIRPRSGRREKGPMQSSKLVIKFYTDESSDVTSEEIVPDGIFAVDRREVARRRGPWIEDLGQRDDRRGRSVAQEREAKPEVSPRRALHQAVPLRKIDRAVHDAGRPSILGKHPYL